MAQPKSFSFYVRVPDEMGKHIKRIAEKECRTASNVIRLALERYLKESVVKSA